MKSSERREGFSNGIAVFFATLSSTVGLGNIWKFPYVTGKYGGGAFLLIYIISVIFVAMPVMISELYIGRKTGRNPVGSIKALSSYKYWRAIGYMGILSSLLILFYYSAVAGWIYSYIFKAIRGNFSGIKQDQIQNIFNSTTSGTVWPVIWQIVAIAVVASIIVFGVKKGIERITKLLMPVLLILIIVCDIRALLLPGAVNGIKFLFKVDFTNINREVILMALGLSFFKLSLGTGTMITYGSYFTQQNNMIATSAKVAASDTIVSLLAGIAIFPAVFSFGMAPSQGPGLLFITIPLVFSKVPFGSVLIVTFFVLTAIAATTAMLSLFEVPVAYLIEERNLSRTSAVLLSAFIVILFGLTAALSANSSSILSSIKVFGLTFFDFFDFTSQNILLPIGGLLIAIFLGYIIKKKDIEVELSNRGNLNNRTTINIYLFILRYFTPVLLLIVFLSMLGIVGK
jgi:NSS family neurotransmitter:Na+ symporter